MSVDILGPVAQDLLEAVADDDLCDVSLIGADGIPIPASRFVLAARCPVLKRMLYGGFREAKSSSICLLAYESSILRAVVEYSNTNDIRQFALDLNHRHRHRHHPADATEFSVRQLVRLTQAADYLGLLGLQEKANRLASTFMTEHPPLACAVWDQATPGSVLSDSALQIIECRPYAALDILSYSSDEQIKGGGIECVDGDRIVELFGNSLIAAGESFLFEMLGRWFNHATATGSRIAALDYAKQCTLRIRLEDIEPRELLAPTMQTCPFVPQERIFAAVAKQALRASHHRIWRLNCRGKESEERVLVEGAGIRDANGLYYRIQGLANGDLYTKREVACGQQNVYTLSCSVKDEYMECRIFSSQILTHAAVLQLQSIQPTSVSSSQVDPTFQPVLQIRSLLPPGKTASSTVGGRFYQIAVSDSVLFMPGTLAKTLEDQIQSGQLTENSVIKVLEFGLYQRDDQGCSYIHIRKVSVINATPGQQFGNPRDILSIAAETEKAEESSDASVLQSRLACQYGLSDATNHHDGLRQLYSCTYPAIDQARDDTKIPRAGWKVEEHGCEPSPRCDWIPSSDDIFPPMISLPLSERQRPDFQFL